MPLLVLSFASAAPVGTDADFAALTVRPNGPEELDLATGVTTLPEGGEIVYRAENVRLTGGFIRFLEGDFIEAREAVVAGAFGSLEAPELRFEVPTQSAGKRRKRSSKVCSATGRGRVCRCPRSWSRGRTPST